MYKPLVVEFGELDLVLDSGSSTIKQTIIVNNSADVVEVDMGVKHEPIGDQIF